ncbi:MAG: hypothetical protein ABIL09_04225 [Gemmatimonadota bacterium]
MHLPLVALALLLLLVPAPSAEAETAETVLIRQSLEKDRSGRRRGDIELVRAACADRFVHYDARGYADPAGWVVAHEGPETYARAVAADLQANRYEIERAVTLLHVYQEKAFVTTVDSGWVVERTSGARRPLLSTGLWTFRKFEDEWLATALVADVGDSAAGPYEGAAGTPAEAIAAVLRDEAAGWSKGDAGAVVDQFDEEFVAYDSYYSSDLVKLVIVLGNAREYREWLDRRLDLVDYDVQRQVLHTAVGPEGTEALAITADRVAVRYKLGEVTASLDRHVTWTLSRQGGSWKVTNMLLQVKSFQ